MLKSVRNFAVIVCAALVIAAPAFAQNAPIGGATPAITGGGGNLTSFSGSDGYLATENYNRLMNPRAGTATTATANFGNCNAVILRCAQPKCANGGCTEMSVAASITAGCVAANDSCKQYGDDLVNAIAAQLVASSTAAVNAQNVAAQQAAAQAQAAAANNAAQQQMSEMQAEMRNMQETLTRSQAESNARLEQALAAQQQTAAQPAAAAGTVSAIAQAAGQNVSAELLVREQASAKIIAQLDNVDIAMKSMHAAMIDAFQYAGCDLNGMNCTGPKRVAAFKQKVNPFFDQYDNVLDETENALLMAMALGVDMSDAIMMMSGSCNMWGRYLCGPGQQARYASCPDKYFDTKKVGDCYNCGGAGNAMPCPDNKNQNGKIIPEAQGGCRLVGMMSSRDEVLRDWLYPEDGDKNMSVQVACASDAVANMAIFGTRRSRQQQMVGIDDLRDALAFTGDPIRSTQVNDYMERCAITDNNLDALERAVVTGNIANYVDKETGG